MGKIIFCLTVLLFTAIGCFKVAARTDDLDVQVLRSMYWALSRSPQLDGWVAEGGDPCGDSWRGVLCQGSSVKFIQLPGLGLIGNVEVDLFNLRNLEQLDLSFNEIHGGIPLGLPVNITHLNLARNKFSYNIPYSLSRMQNLRYLNLSSNQLSGVLGDFYGGLHHLKEMDLSFNHFTGDLPSSFGSLTNLSRLYLQGNALTGSVVYLAKLPLSELNIQDNNFSGVMPEAFQNISNLWLGGNRFHNGDNYPPWKYPFESLLDKQNISTPPSEATEATSTIETYSTKEGEAHKNRKVGLGTITVLVVSVSLVAAFVALAVTYHIRRSQRKVIEGGQSSLISLEAVSSSGCSSTAAECSPHLSFVRSPPGIRPWHLPPVQAKAFKVSRSSFSKRTKFPISAKLYSTAELQLATNSFSTDNFLGEGSIGSVYRAQFPDGEILVVKNIRLVELSLVEEERFLKVVRQLSTLRHPNIVALLGYCVEHGQHLLVYEYVRNLSLHDALHSKRSPLSWGLRLRIALGIARGLHYLHSSCVPPIVHSNLKSGNILLDKDQRPRISDCGLAILRPLSSNSVKLKASEMAIADRGYVAPENVPSGDNLKGDVYTFGVLLLELLTGRLPFNSSYPYGEQYLVRWASARLYDRDHLTEMVDPTIKSTVSSQDLSRFTDIVLQCIQSEREFRPAVSEIVESLLHLIQKLDTGDESKLAEAEVGLLNLPILSSNTHFCPSPCQSYYSI